MRFSALSSPMRQFVVSILAAIVGFVLAKATIGVRRESVRSTPPFRAVPEPAIEEVPAPIREMPLGSAMRTVAEIDAMTLADFQAIAEDPSKFPKLNETLRIWDLGDAFLDALVERWLEVDPTGGFAAIRKVAAARPDGYWPSLDLRNALARHRPAEVLASLPDKLQENQLWREACPAMQALAKRDIRAAHAALERFTNPFHRERAEHALAEGLAENDPVAAAAFARQHGSTENLNAALLAASRIGRETMRQVIAAGGEKLRPGGDFTELMLRFPDEDWNSILDKNTRLEGLVSYPRIVEAMRLPAVERLRILEKFDQFSKNLVSAPSDALMRAWTVENPSEALNWALSKTNSAMDERLRTAFDFWLNDDAAAARRWLSQLPDSIQRTELGNRLAADLAEKGDLESALTFFVPNSSVDSVRSTGNIAAAKARTDPAAAAEWLAGLPSQAGGHHVIQWVLGDWFRRDPNAVAAWIEALPKGKMRDKSLSALTYNVVSQDPVIAGEWVGTIDDPKTKTDMATTVYLNMNRYNPVEARKWLRNLPDIDPVWRDHFLRVNPW
jgi:hypothetical protein